MSTILPIIMLFSQTANAGAAVTHTALDSDECFTIWFIPGLEICIVQTGLMHTTEAASGNLSLTVHTESSVTVYMDGEVMSSSSSEETGHGLMKAGEDSWFQIHDDYCVDFGGYGYTSIVSVANGEIKHEVFEAEGC